MEIEKGALVVVLSRSYSTGLSVIRSLGSAGYTVDLIASVHKPGVFDVAAASKYIRNFSEVVSKKVKDGSDTGLMDELMKYAGQNERKPVLFPTDDYTASVMDMNRSALEEHFIMPTIVGGGDGCMTHLMDKTVQGKLAQKAGLLTPREWIFNLEEKISIPDNMVYPCFCKPIESVSGYKKEMAVCKNRKKLLEHLKKLRKVFSKRSVLVQEFLNIDYEVDLSGVCLDQEIIIPAIIEKTHVAQYERGVTLAGRVAPLDNIAQVKENVLAMLREFHYVGMFDMELNVVGDKLYFNEINLRSGGPNFSYFMSGVNLPALYVKEALGERHTPEEECVSEYGKTFIYEKVAWEDHLHGYMTKKELNDSIRDADIKLLRYDADPKPWKVFQKKMQQEKTRRLLRKLKRTTKKAILFVPRMLIRLPKKLKKAIRNFKTGWKTTQKKISRSFKTFWTQMLGIMLGYPQYKKENRRDPNSELPRVIVAGRNYCSNLCMARSLGEAGYEVEVMRVFQVKPKVMDLMKKIKPDAYSKYVKAFHVCITNRKSERVVKMLMKLGDPNRKMLLIPADDLVAQIADENMKKLSKYYVMPNVNQKPGEIGRLMSKDAQKKLAAESKLPILNSCVIKTKNGKFKIPRSVCYPCFVKPNVSKNSSKSKMKRCNNKQQLTSLLKEYSKKKDVEFLVEDFVKIKKEYAILGLSTQEGTISPGFFVTEKGGHKERRGVAMTGRLLPCEQEAKLIKEINEFVDCLNYEGLFDVDLIETEDGKMYFVELNLRYGASGYLVTACGANLPGMFADYMLQGKHINKRCCVEETGKTFISEKVMIDEYQGGFLSKQGMMECMDEVDFHFVKNDEDPKPYKHFKKFYRVATVMRLHQRVKGKVAKI